MPEFCGRRFAAAQTRRDLESIERVEVFSEPGATANPEFGLCAPSLWTLKEGSNSGGRPDYFDRNRRPHPKSMDWKSAVSSPHGAKAKAMHGVRVVNLATNQTARHYGGNAEAANLGEVFFRLGFWGRWPEA